MYVYTQYNYIHALWYTLHTVYRRTLPLEVSSTARDWSSVDDDLTCTVIIMTLPLSAPTHTQHVGVWAVGEGDMYVTLKHVKGHTHRHNIIIYKTHTYICTHRHGHNTHITNIPIWIKLYEHIAIHMLVCEHVNIKQCIYINHWSLTYTQLCM